MGDMDFSETPIQQDLRNLARRFAENEIAPIIKEDESIERFRPELIVKLGDLGLTGVPLPEIYGGAGLGYQEHIIVIEELAKANIGYAISVAVTGLAQVILQLFGNEEQKSKYIPALAQGRAIGAFSLSEANSGSDAANMKTTALKRGDSYVLNGTKLWTTQGDLADIIIVLAKTISEDQTPKGISALIVEKGTSGLKYGKREKKMGWNTSHTTELIFEQVNIPSSHLIGPEGGGFKIALTALNSGRITIGAAALGIAEKSLEIAIRHSQNREQFGKPISEFQGVSFMLADMAVQLHAARLLVQKSAWLKDQGQAFSQEAAIAKLFATDMAMKMTTDAVQILGGSGYTQDFPVERYMREAKALQIVEGTNQIQRMIIGRNLTHPPKNKEKE